MEDNWMNPFLRLIISANNCFDVSPPVQFEINKVNI
jgi:hypothetical protein